MLSRKLNDYESFLWLLGREEPFLVQCTVMLTGSFDEADVKHALSLCQKQHPLLNSTINNEAPFHYQPVTKAIRLRTHSRETSDSWEEYALAAVNHSLPLADDETFVVTDWVQGETASEFIFTADHGFSDLLCLTGFINDFLKYLDQTLSGEQDIKIKFYPELPPIHDLLPTSKPEAFKSDFEVPFADPDTPLLAEPPYKYKLPYVVQLTEKQTSDFLKKAREHSCSVHALFCAAMSYTLDSFLQDDGYDGDTFCFTPADLRSYLCAEIDDNDFGNFAADVFHPFKVGKLEPFWQLADSIKNDIKQAFATDSISTAKQGIAALFQLEAPIKEVIRGLKIRDNCTAVSNAGIINFDEQFKNFKLTKVRFGSASSIMSGRGKLFWLRAATIHNKLQLEFLRTNPIDELDVVPQFAERFLTILREYDLL